MPLCGIGNEHLQLLYREINFQNFESVLLGAKPGLTRVKLKNGREEWLKATKDEILEAAVEE